MGVAWFDETVDQGGRLRPPYAALQRRAGWNPLWPPATILQRWRGHPFGDDTPILPVPVVLDDTEYRTILRPGLAQRARALQRLFADLILGQRRVLDAGLGLTADLVEEIFTAEGWSTADLRARWRTRDRAAIRFVHGPDLVRGPTGRWTVLEDNTGCVGGTADSFVVAELYRTATGLSGCASCRPDADLAVAVRGWLDRLHRDTTGQTVAVLGCDSGGPGSLRLDENDRRRQILDTLGIPVVDRGQLDGLLARAAGARTAVVNFSVDGSWTEVFARPGVAMLNAPGTGALGNKALLPHLDDVIRFYLRQEPILATPATRRLTDRVLPADPDNWVVKRTTGCQGTEVLVLAWLSPEKRAGVADRVWREWSGTAMVQRYVEPSRLSGQGSGGDGYRLELRPVSYVLSWDDIHVAEQPVGKVVADADGHRLTNMSQGASYAPVLREPCSGCAVSGADTTIS